MLEGSQWKECFLLSKILKSWIMLSLQLFFRKYWFCYIRADYFNWSQWKLTIETRAYLKHLLRAVSVRNALFEFCLTFLNSKTFKFAWFWGGFLNVLKYAVFYFYILPFQNMPCDKLMLNNLTVLQFLLQIRKLSGSNLTISQHEDNSSFKNFFRN